MRNHTVDMSWGLRERYLKTRELQMFQLLEPAVHRGSKDMVGYHFRTVPYLKSKIHTS